MKRFYFHSASLLALLLFVVHVSLAQQNAPSTDNKQVIVIQKVTNDDGTITVRKKNLEKGQEAQSYLDELNLENASGKTEIVIMTDGETEQMNFDGETILFIRKGKGQQDVQSGGSKAPLDELDELRITVPRHEFRHHEKRVEKKTYLGVYPQTAEAGVLITDVVTGSGAEAAGLQANDILTAVNGNGIRSQADLGLELAKYQPGDQVDISYLRHGVPMETKATLSAPKTEVYQYNYDYNYTWKEERDPCKVFFGVYVGSYGEGLEGVGVSGIVNEGDWPAEKAGLQKGDRIIAIDNIPVNNHQELVRERDKHKPGQAFTFTILREGNPIDLEARFKECPGQQDQPTEPLAKELPQQVSPELPPLEFINNTLELEELSVFPNPTYGRLNVKFRGEATPSSLVITDINGKVVHQENLPNFDGIYNKELDLSRGTPGTLLLTIRQGEKVITQPIVLLNRA